MTKNNSHTSKIFKKIIVALSFALALSSTFGYVFGTKYTNAYVEANTELSNLNFSSNSTTTNVYSNPTGWQKGFSESTATSGTINLEHFNDSFYLKTEDISTAVSLTRFHIKKLLKMVVTS